ncbi:hypothetical protein ARTHROSP310_24300, partial [Arthrobacter sp. AD-310]
DSAAPAASAGEQPAAGTDGEQPSRARRNRTRTRRRNGEVVSGTDRAAQPGASEG